MASEWCSKNRPCAPQIGPYAKSMPVTKLKGIDWDDWRRLVTIELQPLEEFVHKVQY